MTIRAYFAKSLALTALFVTAGCASLNYQGVGRSSPDALQPAPTGSVQSNELPPFEEPPVIASDTGTTFDGTAAAQSTAPSGTQVAAASAASTPSSVDVDRSDLLGAWKLASNADNCQLILTLTGWEGGSRATTRGCASTELQSINAWTLEGRQVTLKEGQTPVARLFPTTATQFNGLTLSGGSPISFFR